MHNLNRLPEKFKKNRGDLIGCLVYKLDNTSLEMQALLYSYWMRFVCKIWQVKIQEKSKFYGNTHLSRKPFSTIIIGKNCTFRSILRSNFYGLNRPCLLSTHSSIAKINIGDNCGFSGTSISSMSTITIGDHVLCGANTTISDFDWHSIQPYLRSTDEFIKTQPIIIGSNVWLGAGVTVFKGVTIGENSIIGAGSIVTSSIPSNSIAVGSPARVIMDISQVIYDKK